jgi:hypothetical protein
MFVRHFYQYRLLAAACILGACAATAQTVSTGPTVNAKSILLESINVMGGTAAWQSIHGLQVQANITSQADATPHSLQLLLDWSTGVFRYANTETGPSGTATARFDGTTPVLTSFARHSVPIPQPDPVSFLAEYTPGASIAWVLNTPSYSAFVDTATCPKGVTCIDVSRQPGPFWTTGIFQLQISPTTHLPIAVKRRVPLISSRPVANWDTLTYGPFENQNGLMVPQSVQRGATGPRSSVFSIQAIALNPAVTAGDF